jgi:hypothetical protein
MRSPLALAQAQTELRTGSAIACLAPDKLPAAEETSSKHDRTQKDMLGCFPVTTGVSWLSGSVKTRPAWQVVLDPDGPDPMEVWARPSSFRE